MRLVPATGPWFMTYRILPGTLGVMVSTGRHDVALSAGAFGGAIVIGWRCRKRVFRDRKWRLGRES